MNGGSKTHLYASIRRVLLYDDCAAVGGMGGKGSRVSKAVQRATPRCVARTTKKPNDYMIMTTPTKENSPYQKKGWG